MRKNNDENREKGIAPKKSLGQNFLTSVAALAHIVEAADIRQGEIMLEIGPGKGVLTELLLEAGADVIAIEKDHRLISLLEEKFKKAQKTRKLKLIEGDVLEFPREQIVPRNAPYKLVANIPYYITGMILRKFLSKGSRPTKAVLLVQKEVAQRIMALDKKESLLSLSVKAYGTPRIISIVKAGSFFPKPKVDSAILAIDSISGDFFSGFSEESYFAMLHAGFGQKRKLLRRNLESAYPKDAIDASFKECLVSLNARAEDLTITQWSSLCASLESSVLM